jgi:Prp8 binding protein
MSSAHTQGEILTAQFDPAGRLLASGAADKTIFLWQVYGDCENVAVLRGHKGAVTDLKWSSQGNQLVASCTDSFVYVWDTEQGERIKKGKGHQAIVNAVASARTESLFASASDDKSVRLWDPRHKFPIGQLDHAYPVLSVAFGSDATTLVSASIDPEMQVWDLRKRTVSFKLAGHTDSVTGLSLSPDGQSVLSTSMDSTTRIFDIRSVSSYPYRCLKSFEGAPHGFEKCLIKPAWEPSMRRVAVGSADRSATLWDTATRRIQYKLPGHRGLVTQVHFHPVEPILLSCSLDRQLFLGELAPEL